MKLTTKRLTLEPFSEHIFENIYEIFTNEYVRKYLCDDKVMTKDQVLSFFNISKETFREKQYGLWAIKAKNQEEIIGFTGLFHFFEEKQPQLLYALLPSHTGMGYATEASLKVIDYAFNQLEFTYLDASCDKPNKASHITALNL
ncbi:MAG: GNAT family N-acetyltransferase, partial [Balneolales bacterium]|nr:GNAT family N-acetyltransferase [Balneolales bacterium]